MGMLSFLDVNNEMNMFVVMGLTDLHIPIVVDVILSIGLIV